MKQRIGLRLMAGFATLFLVMALAGLTGQRAIGQAQQHYEDLAEYSGPLRAHVATLISQVYQMSASLRGFGLYQEASYLEAYERAAERADQALRAALALPLTAEDQQALAELGDLLHHFKIINESMTQLSTTGANATAVKILQRGMPVLSELSQKAEALQARVDQRADAEQAVARQQARLAGDTALVAGGVGLVISVLLAFLLTRSITRPIRGLAAVAQRVADGDLTPVRLASTARDETGDLTRAFGVMIGSLQETLRLMQQGGEQLVASSGLLTETATASARNASAIVEQLGALTAEWEADGGRLAATGEEIGQLQAAITQMNGAAERITETMARLTDGLSRNIRTAEAVLAGAGEMKRSVELLERSAHELVDLAGEFESNSLRFRL